MKYIECPQEFAGKEKSLFIAGGISNCGNWQSELIKHLKDENIAALNPRRKVFSEKDSEEQIKWEFKYLQKADSISFWFPGETLCPITLYELGKMSASDKVIFIGVDPKYKRNFDILIQTSLIRPEIKIVYSLKDLADQIIKWSRKNGKS